MNDFLDNLVVRALQLSPVVRPRLPSLFEPPSPQGRASALHEEDTYTAPAPDLQPALSGRGHAEPSKSETSKTMDHAVTADVGRVELSRGTPSQIDDVTLSSPKIVTPVASLAKTPEVFSAFNLASKTTQTHEDTSGVEVSPGDSEVHGPSPRSNVKTRLITANNLTAEQPIREGHALIEAAAKQALAARVTGPATRRNRDEPLAPNGVSALETTPTISVTIGRVEVRAVYPRPQSPTVRRPHPAPMSLDEYFKQRSEGGK